MTGCKLARMNNPVRKNIPSDPELLRSIYRRLDIKALMADHPGLDRKAVNDFFRRLAAFLPGQRTATVAPQAPSKLPRLVLHTDGGSRGNPGPAGYGIVLTDGCGSVLAEQGEYIGRATNNVAEYHGLIAGLKLARKLGAADVAVRMDSELIVRQINGRYKVRSARLLPLYEKASSLLEAFNSWTLRHVPREQNSRADALANQAIERRQKTA